MTIGFAYANSSVKQKVGSVWEVQKGSRVCKVVEKPDAECSVSVTYYSNGVSNAYRSIFSRILYNGSV